MSKITPGPWGLFQFEYGNSADEYAVGPGKFDTVAHVRMGHDDLEGGAKANARAISAVPEMMEALESVLIGGNHLGLVIGADHPSHTATHEEARRHYSADCDKYEVWCCWRAIMNARAALAKAREETP